MKQLIVLFTCLFALQGLAKAENDKPIAVNELPQNTQTFIKQHFPENEISYAKVDKDLWNKSYKVIFVNGQKAEFDKNGEWKEIDCKFSVVPAAIIPQGIKDYITKQYPKATILKIERDAKGFEVKLSNKLELKFNKAFQLTDIDD